jgi:hypothetical protein
VLSSRGTLRHGCDFKLLLFNNFFEDIQKWFYASVGAVARL